MGARGLTRILLAHPNGAEHSLSKESLGLASESEELELVESALINEDHLLVLYLRTGESKRVMLEAGLLKINEGNRCFLHPLLLRNRSVSPTAAPGGVRSDGAPAREFTFRSATAALWISVAQQDQRSAAAIRAAGASQGPALDRSA